MTAQANAYPDRCSPLGAFLLIIFLMLISYVAIQVMLGSHAATRHPATEFLFNFCPDPHSLT
jgi:hypothetical protein